MSIRTQDQIASIARAVTVLLAAAAISLAAPHVAVAKSFSMPQVFIDAQVNGDGSMDVSEKRTWSFEGDFTRVFWDLKESGAQGTGQPVQITDVSVSSETGTMPPTAAPADQRPAGFSRVTSDTPGVVHVDAYNAMSNAGYTYTLRYKVHGAAVPWADTAELYWQFVGTGWTEPTGRVDITLHLPAGVTKADTKAWAHGPPTGLVRLPSDGVVTLGVADLPAGTFVEGRVLFPAAALSAAAPLAESRRAAVLAEEANAANRANAVRTQAKVDVALGGALGAGVPLALLVVAYVLWRRHGREYTPEFQGQYLREDPTDLQAGLVSYLWAFGSVSDQSRTSVRWTGNSSRCSSRGSRATTRSR
jgi:hypothetical protein